MEKKRRKFKKTFNPNIIRADLSYSASDLAELLKVHKQTVLAWHKEGLPVIDSSKPYLFYGKELRAFIKTRQSNRKFKCSENEFYCFKCHQVRMSKDNTVNIRIKDEKHLNVLGICAVCGCRLNKAGSLKTIDEIRQVFTVQQIQEKALLGTENTGSIAHLKEVRENARL
jgi:DNA-binding XRE family transcriptional regulator